MVLRRIGILSLGKFFCFLYGLMGLLFGTLVLLASLLGATWVALNGRGSVVAMLGIGVGAIIVLPLLYGLLGFLAGIIGATPFNFVASMVGGIEIELSEDLGPLAAGQRGPIRISATRSRRQARGTLDSIPESQYELSFGCTVFLFCAERLSLCDDQCNWSP